MSPVFRHGRLRLYLLKLLDEAPRHGYEIIRMLQDRFLGVYAPSPGTIYPRLARLEEEGLVTHDEADGRKVYRITDKGREELRSRLDDLAELEDSITASVRDIAREVTEDVRETVRNLREELAWAVRDVQAGTKAQGPGPGRRPAGERPGGAGEKQGGAAGEKQGGAGEEPGAAAQEQRDAERERLDAEQARLDAERRRLDAEQNRLDAERDRMEAEQERQHAGHAGQGTEGSRRPGAGRGRGGRSWGHWEGRGEEGGSDWGDWAGWARWAGRGWSGHVPGDWADPGAYRDLERLARQFTRDLGAAAWQAQAVSEDAVRELRQILDEAISRIKDEVFGAKRGPRESGGSGGSGGSGKPAGSSPTPPPGTGKPATGTEDPPATSPPADEPRDTGGLGPDGEPPAA